ncbi:S-layer family protein [Fontibacillus phaseoli]|uniref:S-layer family protein n=1 Tax=Fontibacillus phaseoli TaxID=1416533 RepID=A0A369BRH9_9BACL|nr:S-layer homology domain-containing protein [Fontibacillus phaseoli]RCX23067.1 S-layer family protein [Fontibacillus phaseoli]
MNKKVTVSLCVALVLANLQCLSLKSSAEIQPTDFNDIAGHWAKSTIMAAVDKGYVSGYPGELFKPDLEISRAEFVKLVVSSLGLTEDMITSDNDEWYASYVQTAEEQKLYSTSDFENSEESWRAKITRKEMARIAARAVGENTDDDDKWFYLATKKGLITGLGQGQLGEKVTTTRAQAVTIIERVLKSREGAVLPVDKYAVSTAELAWHGTNIFSVMPEVFVTNEKQLNGKPVEELWREDLMVVDPGNGKYKGELEALIAIDLEDPNDPNLKLLPPLEEVKWDYFGSQYNGIPTKYIPVNKLPASYFLLFIGKEVYNSDSNLYYSDPNGPAHGIHGIESPDRDAFFQGELNGIGNLFHRKFADINGYILPKKGWTQGIHPIEIRIYTPVRSKYGYKSNTLLKINGPFIKNTQGDED